MKASNGRDATPAQYLEHLLQSVSIRHARRMRDELGWRWRPSAVIWTLRHHWVSWVVGAYTITACVIDLAANLKVLAG